MLKLRFTQKHVKIKKQQSYPQIFEALQKLKADQT